MNDTVSGFIIYLPTQTTLRFIMVLLHLQTKSHLVVLVFDGNKYTLGIESLFLLSSTFCNTHYTSVFNFISGMISKFD